MTANLPWSAILCGFVLAGVAQGGPIECVAWAGVPPLVPPSPSALASDIVIQCVNLAPAPVTLSFDAHLVVNTNVTSQLINPDGSLETMLLINEPDPSGIVPGTNAFYAQSEASNALIWEDLSVMFPSGVQTVTVLRLSKIWVDTSMLTSPDPNVPAAVLGSIFFTGEGDLPALVNSPQQVIAYVWPPGSAVPEPASLLLTAGALLGLWSIGRLSNFRH